MIPSGTYALGQTIIQGPCKSPITVIVQGTLKAPIDTSHFKPDAGWVAFQYIDHFTLAGNGVFDGQGTTLWGKACGRASYCNNLPIVSSHIKIYIQTVIYIQIVLIINLNYLF